MVEAADALFNAVAWPYVHLRGRHEWPADQRLEPVVVGLVLNGITHARKETSMSLPYVRAADRPREPGERQIPEPPRRGEPGGPPCGDLRAAGRRRALWSDDNWTLHAPVGGSLPGAVWIASREHFDSFADMPEHLAADFGRVVARVERAILCARRRRPRAPLPVGRRRRALPRLAPAAAARDGRGAGMMLPLWEDVLPNVERRRARGGGAVASPSRDVTVHDSLARGSARATPSSSGSAR